MKIVSWNLNGIKACSRKGLLDFVRTQDADVYCFQEIKVSTKDDLAALADVAGYEAHWFPAQKNGYSGVSIWTRIKPVSIIRGIGIAEFDQEGRMLGLDFDTFILLNTYFPHSGRNLERFEFKQKFNVAYAKFCAKLAATKPLVLTGDYNVAHTELDLANPKSNIKNAGFTVEERDWFSGFINLGYIDTFRLFEQHSGHYTWWTWRNDARSRNIGWRIDYFLVSSALKDKVISSTILSEVHGSDHCPIELQLNI